MAEEEVVDTGLGKSSYELDAACETEWAGPYSSFNGRLSLMPRGSRIRITQLIE
jgi:hypothetical protein